MIQIISKFTAILLVISLNPVVNAKTWTRASDGKTIEADFVGKEGDLIILKLANGSIAKVPKDTFIQEDIAAIADLRPGLGDRTAALGVARKIDGLLAAELKKQGFTSFNDLLPDDLFVRRTYLDIIGRIPTRQEFDTFVKSREPNKRPDLIDELLTHPGYVHHTFNYFADMYRFKGDGYIGGVRLDPYFQWWREQLAANTHYDEMVRKMVTAKGSLGQDPATGFIMRDIGMFFDAFSNFSQVMLGIDISCAQCHDHPFEDIAIDDFYQMAAFFQETTRRGGFYFSKSDGKKYFKVPGGPEHFHEDLMSKLPGEFLEDKRKAGAVAKLVQTLRHSVADIPGKTEKVPQSISDELEDIKGTVFQPGTMIGKPVKPKPGQTNREALADWLVADDNPRFALVIANRMWERAFGRPLVGPVYDVKDLEIRRAPQKQVLAFIMSEMKRINYDLREFMRILYYTRAYQSQYTVDEPDLADPYYFQGPLLRRMRAEQVWDSLLVLARGPEIDEERGYDGSVIKFGSDIDFEKSTTEEIVTRLEMWSKVRRLGQSFLPEGSTEPEFVVNPEYRASILEQPAPPAHLLDTFGQSDRLVTDEHSYDGSVPQVLAMMNGTFTEKLVSSNSSLIRDLSKIPTSRERANAVYHAFLSRNASMQELSKAEAFLNKNGDEGLSDLAWALINNPEFIFIR